MRVLWFNGRGELVSEPRLGDMRFAMTEMAVQVRFSGQCNCSVLVQSGCIQIGDYQIDVAIGCGIATVMAWLLGGTDPDQVLIGWLPYSAKQDTPDNLACYVDAVCCAVGDAVDLDSIDVNKLWLARRETEHN